MQVKKKGDLVNNLLSVPQIGTEQYITIVPTIEEAYDITVTVLTRNRTDPNWIRILYTQPTRIQDSICDRRSELSRCSTSFTFIGMFSYIKNNIP